MMDILLHGANPHGNRVTILYNDPILPVDHPDADSEWEIYYTVDEVEKNLRAAGLSARRLAVQRDLAVLVRGLTRQRPDVIFNLFEGLPNCPDSEAQVAGMLEWLGLPFTGCPAKSLLIANDKVMTKNILRGAGLPTANFFVVESMPVPRCSLEWPVIVKPANQDASVGLDQGSVVSDQAHLEERVSYLLDTYEQPVLVEEYIHGREFNVALIETPELQVLPPSEIEFAGGPDFWPIVTYDAKWKPESRDFQATPARYPADVTPRLQEKLAMLARRAFQLLGCRDYARVDFRVRPGNRPYILEVNPNPDFSPLAGLANGLKTIGSSHARFTVELAHRALTRLGTMPSRSEAPL